MAPWLVWFGELLQAFLGFLQNHPLPHGQRVAYRQMMRAQMMRPAAVYILPQVTQIPSEPPQFEALPETVVDTIQQQECFGNFCRLVTYQWVRGKQAGVLLLHREGKLIGGWNVEHRLYLDYNGVTNRWGAAWQDCPPCPCPNEVKIENLPVFGQEPIRNEGIQLDKMPKSKAWTYSINGQDCSRDAARYALPGNAAAVGPIPDDKDSLKVTHVGSVAAGNRLRGIFDGRSNVSFQSYQDPNHPMIRNSGYLGSGFVYFQTPKGVPVNFCAEGAAPDELGKATEVAQLRLKDPDWDPLYWKKLAEQPKPPEPAPAPAPDDKDGKGNRGWYGLALLVLAWLGREVWPFARQALGRLLVKKSGGAFTDEQLAELLKKLEAQKAKDKPV